MINAADNLIMDNTKLVHKICQKYYRYVVGIVEYDDLFQYGMIGLIKAAQTFDESQNFQFSTYAYTTIRNEILLGIRKCTLDRNRTISLQTSVTSDEQVILEDILRDNFNLEKVVEANLEVEILKKLLTTLPDNMQLVLNDRLAGIKQEITAKKLGVTRQRVSKLYSDALYKLRLGFRKEGLL